MDTIEGKFRDYLKAKGLKFTPERELILETMFSFHGHFDIEQLYDKLHKKNHLLSMATIYRTLPYLINSGLIKEVFRCQNRPQYEKNFGLPHHDHLICVRCGRIIEFKEEEIERLQERVCKRFGFKTVEHRLGIRGYCKNCLQKIKNS
ncbi:MAG: transcriptional repressor [Candidatus Omnitrophica bacterium]|nr:transcriptional repressor [Candidatus Omnitrophota bacterium]